MLTLLTTNVKISAIRLVEKSTVVAKLHSQPQYCTPWQKITTVTFDFRGAKKQKFIN